MKPIISKNIRIRVPDHFNVGENSVIDDYSYFSTKIEIGKFSHIAHGCSIAGGKDRLFKLGDYCSVSSGVKIWCTSDDFTNDLVVIIPEGFTSPKNNLMSADVIISDMCAVGSNTVIMPGNNIPEGVSIGALSFVPANFEFEPWSVYAGVPIKKIKDRNKESVLRQRKELEDQIKD